MNIFLIIIILIIIGILLFFINKRILYNKYIIPIITPKDFQCSIDFSQYTEGLNWLKSKKVIIAGLIRNGEDNIEFIKHNIKKVESIFKDYHVLIVENDSTDNTRSLLLEWAEHNSKISILGCGLNADECKLDLPRTIVHDRTFNRIKKMVILRNIYLDFITDNLNIFNSYDFVIIWDLDIKGSFYIDGMGMSGHYFKNNPKISALCSNAVYILNIGYGSKQLKYDSYAHREQKENERLKPLDGLWKVLDLEKCSDDNDIRELSSCFGGFTIYRLRDLIGHRYFLQQKNEEALCEHYTLNKQIGDIYVNPKMVFVILENK
jgi:hypothetical protein